MWKLVGEIDYSDTKTLAHKLLSENDFYIKYEENVFNLLKEEDFKNLYGETGHPNDINPVVMAHILIIQALEDKTDRKMARAVATRIDIKCALHLPLSFKLHFDTISEFRIRLMENKQESLILDKILEFLNNKGLIDLSEQRLDSTVILSRGRKMKRYETVQESLKKATRSIIKKTAPETKVHKKAKKLLKKYKKRRVSFKETEEEMDAKLAESLIDAKELLDLAQEEEELKDLKELKLLNEVYNQQGEVICRNQKCKDKDNKDNKETGSGSKDKQVKIIPNSKLRDNIVNPNDYEARCGAKGSNHHYGHKVQLSETTKGKIKVINYVKTHPANEQDSKIYKTTIKERKEKGVLPEIEYTDKGYLTGKNLCIAEKNEVDLRALVSKPKHKVYGFEHFKISHDGKVATCPAGKNSKKMWEYYDKRAEQRVKVYEFSKKDCRVCLLKANCTNGKHRKLIIGEYTSYLQRARERSSQPKFVNKVIKKRSGVEGTISQFIKLGGRRSRWFGGIATGLANFFRACAINVRRYIQYTLCQESSITQEAQGPPATQNCISYASV